MREDNLLEQGYPTNLVDDHTVLENRSVKSFVCFGVCLFFAISSPPLPGNVFPLWGTKIGNASSEIACCVVCVEQIWRWMSTHWADD